MAYDAFISYSHAADDALAPALQQGLQTLARPWNRRRALEIFRDDTGLAVSPGLWSSICAALDESDYFVLLASPEAASSVWVNREIDQWAASHPIDHLLPVVTDGKWIWDSTGDFDWDSSTAVPPALRGLFTEEPRHLDLAWARTETELDLRNSRFREAVAQLAAPMHSMTPQDLESADVANYKHVKRLRRGVIIALTVLLLLVSIAGVFAFQNARDARRAQASADSSAQEAEQQADRNLAGQLLLQADVLRNSRKTLSLLLTLEAATLTPDQAWSSLIDGLRAGPGLTTILDLPAGVDADSTFAVGPTGDVLAAPNREGDVLLWDLRTGQRLGHKLTAGDLYPESASQLVFSPTGALAVRYDCLLTNLCARKERFHSDLQIGDPATSKGRTLPGSDGFSDATFSTDGEYLAAYAEDGRVRVWQSDDRRIVAEGRLAGVTPTDLALSATGESLVMSARGNAGVHIWRVVGARLKDPKVIRWPVGDFPAQVALGDGGLLVTRDQRGGVAVWDSKTTSKLGALSGRPAVDVALDSDGTLAVADVDGVLELWDANSRTQIGTPHQSGSVKSRVDVAFASDGTLVSAGADIRLWDVEGWDDTGSSLYRHSSGVTSLAVASNGVLVSGDRDGLIMLSDLGEAAPPRQIPTGQGSVSALALADQGTVASGGSNGTVRLWDSSAGTPPATLRTGRPDAITSLAFSPDGDTLAVGYRSGSRDQESSDAPIELWDVPTRELITSVNPGLADEVSTVAYSGEGVLGVAANDNVTTFDPANALDSTVITPVPRGLFSAIAFSPDGNTLASSGFTAQQARFARVVLWDVTVKPAVPSPLETPHTSGWDGRFVSLAYSPSGSVLAGASAEGVQLWDLSGHVLLGGMLGPPGATSLVISPDGEQIIAGDDRGRVQSYPATIEGWRTAACAVVSRNLTPQEWEDFIGSGEAYHESCPDSPSGS